MRKPTASERKGGRQRRPSAPAEKSRRRATATSKSRSRSKVSKAKPTLSSGEGRVTGPRSSESVLYKVSPISERGQAGRGKYVYCIIEASDTQRFGAVGIGAEPSEVYTVHYKNLAAVVSEAPLEVL